MTTYTRPVVNGTPTTGQTIKAAHINEPVDFLFDTVLAGGITDDQLAALSVTEGKIATAAVTQSKIEGTLPDGSSMATSAAPGADAELANKKYVDDITHVNVEGSPTSETTGALTIHTWTDLKLTDVTAKALVILRVSGDGFSFVGVRPKGDTAYKENSMDANAGGAHVGRVNITDETATLITPTDASGNIDVMSGLAGMKVTVVVVGYILY